MTRNLVVDGGETLASLKRRADEGDAEAIATLSDYWEQLTQIDWPAMAEVARRLCEHRHATRGEHQDERAST